MNKPLQISEQSIRHYGISPVALWAYCYVRCPNGVVMRGWEHGRKERLGWSRSVFFKKMKVLLHANLVRKDYWGNYRLLPVWRMSKAHKCSLLINNTTPESEIRDLVKLKLVEEASRQGRYRLVKKDHSKSADKGSLEELGTEKAGTGIPNNVFACIGKDRDYFVKLAADSKYVPMSTNRLLHVMGVSRGSLFSWKRRVKERSLLDQMNIYQVIPPSIAAHDSSIARQIEEQRGGRVVFQKNKGVYVFVQPSCYKTLVKYA